MQGTPVGINPIFGIKFSTVLISQIVAGGSRIRINLKIKSRQIKHEIIITCPFDVSFPILHCKCQNSITGIYQIHDIIKSVPKIRRLGTKAAPIFQKSSVERFFAAGSKLQKNFYRNNLKFLSKDSLPLAFNCKKIFFIKFHPHATSTSNCTVLITG